MIYLGINLTKGGQDLYTENYETSMRKITENINKLKHLLIKTQYFMKIQYFKDINSFQIRHNPNEGLWLFFKELSSSF